MISVGRPSSLETPQPPAPVQALLPETTVADRVLVAPLDAPCWRPPSADNLLRALKENFGTAWTPWSKIREEETVQVPPIKPVAVPLPLNDGQLEQQAQDLEENESSGALGTTSQDLADTIRVSETLGRAGAVEPELGSLSTQSSEAGYEAQALRKSLKAAATSAGEARILSTSASRSHTTTRVRPRGPVQPRTVLGTVTSSIAKERSSRRNQALQVISSQKGWRVSLLVTKRDQAEIQAREALAHASALDRALTRLRQGLDDIQDQPERRGALWRLSNLGETRRLEQLSNHVPGEAADLLAQIVRGVTGQTGPVRMFFPPTPRC